MRGGIFASPSFARSRFRAARSRASDRRWVITTPAIAPLTVPISPRIATTSGTHSGIVPPTTYPPVCARRLRIGTLVGDGRSSKPTFVISQRISRYTSSTSRKLRSRSLRN